MRIEHKLLLPLFLLTISNTLTAIDEKVSVLSVLLYIIIFVAIGIILQLKKIINNTKSIPIILLLFSIISTINSNGFGVVAGFFYLSYSLYILKLSKKLYIIYGSIYSILLMYNFYSHNYTSQRTIGYLSGILFLFIIYQHYIHPKKTIKKELELNYINLPVKKSVIDILKLRILGFDWWEINDKLELTCTAKWTNEQVNKEMKLHGFKNRESFIYYLIENGAIKTKKPLSNTD